MGLNVSNDEISPIGPEPLALRIGLLWREHFPEGLPKFEPNLHFLEPLNRLYFLGESVSYYEPMEGISPEFRIEYQLQREFPDAIKLAQGKSTVLDDPLFPPSLFFLRATHSDSYGKKDRVIGFFIQGDIPEELKLERKFSQEESDKILQYLVKKYIDKPKIHLVWDDLVEDIKYILGIEKE